MLASAVLLFILGILSVLEKPLALRAARIDPGARVTRLISLSHGGSGASPNWMTGTSAGR
jgi:hypothetical protein